MTRAYPEFKDGSDQQAETPILSPVQLGEYMLRLFRDPASLVDRYSNQQLGDGMWFIFGVGACYFSDLHRETVPQTLRIDVVRAVGAIYSELFDSACKDAAVQEDGTLVNTDWLGDAVFMIWDMGQLQHFIHSAHIPEIGFEVLRGILRLPSTTCRMSAPHGLGEQFFDDSEQVAAIIDEFLGREKDNILPGAREYALNARTGGIQ